MSCCDAYSSPADDEQVLAASDSWHSDAFAGATGEGKLLALASMAVRTLAEIESLESQPVSAMTSFVAMCDAGLARCHRSSCSSVDSAGNYLHQELMGSMSLAG